MNKVFMMQKPSFILPVLVFLALVWLPVKAGAVNRIQPVGDVPVIIIDPGHGGENLGTTDNDHLEKQMNLITAKAMYEALCQYDNVEVYLTRTEDSEPTLKERAQFAADKNADFVFSIHYNASENHQLFGSELWVPLQEPFNNYGYQFGCEYLELMRQNGLFLRGIKTRRNSKGLDYYGIIRECASLNIPAVILEHCHVDEAHDEAFCATEEDLIRFGLQDAEAVARYFGLKSSISGADYSEYALVSCDPSAPVVRTLPDLTAPDFCRLEFVDADMEMLTLKVSVSAQDKDSTLLYYDFSLDGGQTFSARFPWSGSDALTGAYEPSLNLTVSVPDGTQPKLIVRAYNGFDLFTQSNVYESPEVFIAAKNEPSEDKALPGAPVPIESIAQVTDENNLFHSEQLMIVAFLVLTILASLLILWMFARYLVSEGSKSSKQQ